ncbi:Os02g0234000 [Oryza sativa Japonica Group]|uniref:Os02g0234000 protein n=1 Tax=Oryza sativa subsp. japonica TaxID=39947 RepID=C7IYB9_ORYSJ|nr:Os02g0234000 [Oryza sativa Japonica Group]|eukprot:NP_001172871.1 Os02g0234000 [Oryza sativa Japonica Group]
MTPWNTDSDSDSDTRKKPIWRTYIFEFLSSHLLQPLAPASTCAQVLDQQLAPRHGSRHPAPPSLRDLNADPPAEDDDHIVHLHGEPLPQPPYFPEPKPPPTSTVVEAVAVAVVVAAAAASPATCHYIWRLIQAIKPLLTIGQRNNRQDMFRLLHYLADCPILRIILVKWLGFGHLVNFIMENYLKRKVPDSSNNARTSCPEVNDLNWKEEIKYDPGLRKPIDAYHPNLRDRIQSEDAKKAYFTRLNGSISVARRLLKQGLPFRGYDESKDSYNKGNFLEFHDMLLEHDHALGKAVGKYGAGNSLMTSSDIQKDIVECFAKEILHSIMEELGHDVFCLLVDESRDVSYKEQMAVVLRYVDKCGFVKERFIEVVHVKETTSSYLKAAIDSLFAGFKLSLKQVRGQGYDGASNMRGCGMLQTGTGLNQEQCLQRPGDTRWSSHYKTLKSLLDMFPTIVKVLEFVEKDDKDRTNRDQANGLLVYFQSFEFVFYLHLMSTILIITNTLSLALQRKDQDIVNAVKCVKSTRCHLDDLRRDGWENLLGDVYAFCDKYDIIKLEMGEAYVNPKKQRQKTGITNQHHYEVDCFNDVIDWLLQELDSRFNETSSELLLCSAAFSPRESFHDFNVENLMRLAKLYPNDFNSGELRDLRHHLCLYTADVREDDRFSNIQTIASPLDPAPPSLRDLNADPPAEDDDHIVHLHGEPLPQPPYFPEPNAAADLDGGLDGDAEASFPGSNPEADGRELDGDLEQDHSLFMFLDPGEVRCRKRLRASEEDDVDVGDARGAPGRCYDDDVAEDGRSTQSRYSWRPRNADDQSYTHDDDTPAAQEISGEQIAADDTYYDSYYYMDGEYGGAYDEEEHQQDDMAAADFHDGNQLSPEHQRVLYRLFGEADGSTRQEEQEAAAQGSGGEHVPPEEDSYEAAAVLAGDDVDEEQLQRQEQVDMTDGTDETF